jgi:hypothetical protein
MEEYEVTSSRQNIYREYERLNIFESKEMFQHIFRTCSEEISCSQPEGTTDFAVLSRILRLNRYDVEVKRKIQEIRGSYTVSENCRAVIKYIENNYEKILTNTNAGVRLANSADDFSEIFPKYNFECWDLKEHNISCSDLIAILEEKKKEMSTADWMHLISLVNRKEI